MFEKIERIMIILVVSASALITGCKPSDNYQANTELNHIVKNAMIKDCVPAASLAIIDHDKTIYLRSYVNPHYSKLRVTPNTKFQAGSVSKAVTAFATLLLVDQGKLKLDQDVNRQLKSWKIPGNKFTTKNGVTVREILSMTSGLSVHGFAGYSRTKTLPTLLQILDGRPPANSKPIRVKFIPGSTYAYSGGAFLVLQQLMVDVTGRAFLEIMEQLLLQPLGMSHSLYTKALGMALWPNAVPGFHSMKFAHGDMVKGAWHNYPELAAGSLWSTPHDLALFVINIMNSYKGYKGGLLSKQLAREMLTRQKSSAFGLGVIIHGHGKTLSFVKNGRNLGYVSTIIGFPNTGQGAVLMINSQGNLAFMRDVIRKIAKIYSWPRLQANRVTKPIGFEDKFVLSMLVASTKTEVGKKHKS